MYRVQADHFLTQNPNRNHPQTRIAKKSHLTSQNTHY